MENSSLAAIVIATSIVLIGYIMSKGWRSKARLTAAIVWLAFSFAFALFIIDCWKTNDLGFLSAKNLTSISQLQIIPALMAEYLFISATVICFHSWRKDGIKNLKGYCNDEAGIIGYLGFGFVIGIFFGIVATLTFGLGGMAMMKSSYYLLVGPIIGFGGGLFLGLIFGITAGSICERKRKRISDLEN